MFKKPSLITRIAISKIAGLGFGLLGFVLLPVIWPEASMLLRVGILFWYITLGAIIGIFGVLIEHPVIKLPLPWWARGPLLGAWMNLVLACFAYDDIQAVMIAMCGENSMLYSPFWIILEGAIIGLIIDYFATRFGGEGKETVLTTRI